MHKDSPRLNRRPLPASRLPREHACRVTERALTLQQPGHEHPSRFAFFRDAVVLLVVTEERSPARALVLLPPCLFTSAVSNPQIRD